jgi:hypothetical protein
LKGTDAGFWELLHETLAGIDVLLKKEDCGRGRACYAVRLVGFEGRSPHRSAVRKKSLFPRTNSG